ncbi:phosphatase PAP2 family protein [Spongiactinospora sp. 9N601]|uniref:vanadium-dependent haloperoxidase n=1 Tax=Spongiactinospora sp. 9N601 TaxID=3375149 RepID=UPI0037899446
MSRIRPLIGLGAAAALLSGALVAPPSAAAAEPMDHVIYWNKVLLDVNRGVKTADAGPTRLSRTAAMMNGAIYDAANSAACATPAGCIGQPYLTQVASPPGASPDVSTAIDHAAYRVLSGLYPRVSYPQFDFDARLGEAQATIPASVTAEQRAQGAAIGGNAAAVMAVTRANDGANATIAYTPGDQPGDWRPTGSGPALDPHWGAVQPFTMITTNHFRPNFPERSKSVEELLTTTSYKDQVEEVRRLGRLNSPDRTPDQTQAAHFWSNDLDGTYKPPGQHIDHTIQVLKEAPLAGRTQLQNAKLFALVSLAMGDAAISAWDVKFDTDTDLWRPESAIRLRDVDPETGWKPESRNTQGVSFSPPFPAYISGHATFGGAWAGIMKRYLGTDALAWTGTTDDPFAQGVQRRFTSFSGAANENALGRVWLGVHYRFDGQFGVATGDRVADWVNGNFLGAPSPGATLVADTFNRTVTNGFGTADAGGAWWVGAPAGSYAVNAGQARITLTEPSAGRSAYPNRVISTGTDLAFKVGLDKLATGNGVYVTAVGRRVDGAGNYRSTLIIRPDGAVMLQLRRADSAGTETALAPLQTIPGISYTPGSLLHLRLQVVGTSPTTLRAKVWPDGTPEPAAWHQTVTDSTPVLQGAGRAGLLAYLSGTATNAPVTVNVDDFTIKRVTG